MKALLILITSALSFTAFASGGSAPSTLDQDVTCFALPDPISATDKPVDVTKIEPSLFIHLQIIEGLGKITIRDTSSEKTYNGYFSKPVAVKVDALVPDLCYDEHGNTKKNCTPKYNKANIQALRVSLSTEPSPYPSVDITVPGDHDILDQNKSMNHVPYLTDLSYVADSVAGKVQNLKAVCYTAR